MKKKNVIRLLACVLAAAMPITAAMFVFAEPQVVGAEAYSKDISYESPDINKLTGMGEEPEDLSVSAGAEYLEKAWYEYVTYSDKAVASYRLNDDSRLLFYDPYTYTNAMVMDVQFDATTNEFDTMSSYTISKTTSKTISACVESTSTSTNATQTSGTDKTGSNVQNGGTTKTTYNHNISDTTEGKVEYEKGYSYIDKHYQTTSLTTTSILETETTVGVDLGVATTIGINTSDTTNNEVAWLTDKETETVTYGDGYKTTTTYDGTEDVEYDTNSKTEGWTQLSARVTKTLGSSMSTNNSWSEEESVTITKTYAATHFASDNVTPLPWAIVHYEVQMPMKVCMQVKHSGEWVTASTVYCMLTTVKGTCRAWMQNGQVYYEDWGSGEPVVAADFWAQFLTKEQLMNAYTNKLYPVGGEN